MKDKNSTVPKVIYIMGTARSGTTILAILLASGSGCFGAGEMTALPEDGWLHNRTCACGEPFYHCSVWSQVVEQMHLSTKQLQIWKQIQKKMDWHTGFVRQLFKAFSAKDAKKYGRLNHQLVTALCTSTKADTIIDSSKYAGRALALSRHTDLDLRCVCMTRDPAGLLDVFQTKGIEHRSKSPVSALMYYIFVTGSIKIASHLLHKRVLFLTLEELISDPDNVLQRIERHCEVDLGETRNIIEKQGLFTTGHVVTGNRLRKQKNVRLQQQHPPLRFQPTRLSCIITAFMRWWKKQIDLS